ncbi:PREDICTED: NAD(P)(+)--arginine ADP-ribosyltransferase 2-like [Ficedula albicollis]|uniref:NAD(P)(+)--arginine ADP-ribosyltransferase 2-like n=1 Tax=Ficedula albicollis TaxID=59894 RepID=UPI000359968B|nr:PREDICTED: NAD(P)(+)--arginine ADP-ribosyltransferase 2-like [Ficedula albicollis]
MVPNSFDDQYQHCRLKMLRALPALNRSEFVLSSPYAEAWGKAAALWNSRACRDEPGSSRAEPGSSRAWLGFSQARLGSRHAEPGSSQDGPGPSRAWLSSSTGSSRTGPGSSPGSSQAWPRSSRVGPGSSQAELGSSPGSSPAKPGSLLRPEQAIALLAYTMEERLYVEFNRAVRRVGRSRREYLNNFHFKVLHFLLTGALRALRGAHSHPRCLHVFRGVDRIRFTARPGQIVRFGQFASSSLLRNVSDFYGTTTTFEVHTCHGADIRRYSIYPEEEEVLIPPYETFNVTGVTQQGDEVLIQLRSHGVHSKYNCAWFRGRSIPRAPPGLTGLLLAALAAVTSTP